MRKPKFWLPPGQLFLPTGRVNRLQYLAYFLILVAVALITIGAVDFGLVRAMNASADLEAFPSAIFVYLLFCLLAKRLHDLKLPAIIGFILAVVPVVQGYADAAASHGTPLYPANWAPLMSSAGSAWNLISGIGYLLLFALPGNKGDNRYGRDSLASPISEANGV